MAASAQQFVWEGVDKAGRSLKGEVAGASLVLARAQLRRQGISPTRVARKRRRLALFKPRVTQADIALFTRQLATMVKAGIPLVQAFDIVASGLDKPPVKALALRLRDQVAAGNPFASALRSERDCFDALYCNLVHAGEEAGALDAMLDRVASYKEKTEAMKARIRSAMKYPLAVLLVAAAVCGLLLVKVIPQFEQTFAGFGAELPAYTQLVVDLSRFMQAWWPACLLALAAAWLACKGAYRRWAALRDALDRLALRLPVLGDLLDKSCTARFARTLATSYAAGVPLVDALASVAGAVGNAVYHEAVNQVRDQVSGGTSLAAAMQGTGVFPKMAVQMVAIGEEAGALDAMLDKAAGSYEEMVDAAVEGLTTLVEPLIMLTLSIIIGGLVTAMYLPIFFMGEALGL